MTAPTTSRDETWYGLLTPIFGHWRLISKCGLGMGLLAGTISFLSPRQYTSTAAFIPDASTEAGAGLLAAARQFGLAGGVPTSDAWLPGLYVEVLQSRPLLTAILLDTMVVREEGGLRTTLLDLVGPKSGPEGERIDKALERIRRQIIDVDESRLTGSVHIRVTTEWASVSAAVARQLIAKVDAFNLIARQGAAKQELNFLGARFAEELDSLQAAEDRLQVFLQRNRAGESPQLQFERERLQRQVTFHNQLTMDLASRKEDARHRAVRNTPAVTVIEPPVEPGLGDPRGTILRTLLGGIVGGMLGVTLVLLGLELGRARRDRPEEMDRFREAVAGMLPPSVRSRVGSWLRGIDPR